MIVLKIMSVKVKILHFLSDQRPHSKYAIREYVMSWGRPYDQQTIDRQLQLLVSGTILRSKRIDNKIWYRMNI